MCKNIAVGIIPLLRPIVIYVRLCQNLSVRGYDLSADDPVGKGILSGVVGTVDKILASDTVVIDQIADQTEKNRYKEPGYKGIFPVSFSALFSNLFLTQLPLSLGLSSPPLFDISQFLRPHLPYKYTIPG